MIELAPIDHALLDGVYGAGAAHAMDLLVRYGEAIGAEFFITIQSAHIDGCVYHGPSSLDFVRRFMGLGAKVRVPTTLNVAAVDIMHPDWNAGDPALIPAQAELTTLYEALGCHASLTCAPYQRIIRPLFGEHIAWAESNAIVFANSVLGARTDRYGDFTDLCAAITGRVPYAGLHCDENRRAKLIVEVVPPRDSDLPRDLYFAALGYCLGDVAGDRVPLLDGLPADTTEDELKSLGAAAASSGAIALFHVLGLTPEASTIEQATGNSARPPSISIDAASLTLAAQTLCTVRPQDRVAAVCLGTPHFSVEEFRTLSSLVENRTRHPSVEVYVSTSRDIAAHVLEGPDAAALEGFGIKIVVDTCTYVAPMACGKDGSILTNSAKFAHYGPGNLRRQVALLSLERCIASAEIGAVAPP
jgi:predicted aconitase